MIDSTDTPDVSAADTSADDSSPAEQLLEAGRKAKAEKSEKKPEKAETKAERKKSAAAGLREFLEGKEKAEKSEGKAGTYSEAADKAAEKAAEAKRKDRERKAEERAAKAEPKPEKKTEAKEDSADDSADAEEPDTGATEEDATSKTEAKIDKVADAIEAEGGEAPDQRKNESDKQYELRLARTLRDLKDAKAEALQEKRRAAEAEKKSAEAEAKVADFEKKLARAKNPETVLDALEEFGWTLESLARGVVDKKVALPKQKPAVDPELAAKIERLEKAEKDREAERVRTQSETQRRSDETKIATYLKENPDKYPLLASFGEAAAADVVAEAYATKASNAEPVLAKLEENLVRTVTTLLGNSVAAKALAKSNPGLKKALAEALELSEAAPVKAPAAPKVGVEKKTIATKSVSSETAATSTKMSMADRKKAAAAELAEMLRAQRG